MSEQHGASSSLASIATTPPSYGTPHTTSTTVPSDSQPSDPARSASAEVSSVSRSSNPARPSSTPSTKVHIPKLSAATTELLARVTGRLQGEPHQQQQRNDTTPIRWAPSSSQSLNRQLSNNMKASSTIIELPTAPFVYSHHMTAAASAPTPTPQPQQNHSTTTIKPPNLVHIAPKPTEPPFSTPSPLLQSQFPSYTSGAPAAKPSSPAYVPKRTPGAGPRQRKSGTRTGKRTKKRRRGHDSDSDVVRAGDSSSDESDVAPTATQTKSGRQVNRPSLYVPSAPSPSTVKEDSNSLDTSGGVHAQGAGARKRKRAVRRTKDANINCMHCQRGHSPLSNAIVFCDECNRAWHQLCHDPPIAAEVVTVKEKEWHCRECKPVPMPIVQPTVVRSNPSLGVSSLTLDRPIFPPTEIPKPEVGAEGFSTDERRGFLSCLSHSALVELLIKISDNHPTIPMFPENLKSLHSSRFAFPPKMPTPSPSTSANNLDAGPTVAGDVSEKIRPLPTPDVLPTPSSEQRRQDYGSDSSSEYEVEDHRLYPRAGNGFGLSLDVDDLDIMREDPDCPTFSYALHGPAQVRAQTNHPAPVWGV